MFLATFSKYSSAQEIIKHETDSTFFTDYVDGHEWGYLNKDNFIVGMTSKFLKDDYGKFYQIYLYIYNNNSEPYTFDPELISSELYRAKGDTIELKVYTNDAFQKKIKRSQGWAMALTGFSNGLNAGMAGYQTSYTTQRVGNYTYTTPITTYNYAAASAAQTASNTQMMILDRQMKEDRVVREEGYLKKNTIYPNEAIVGFMNIKYKKGEIIRVNIPVNGNNYSFLWGVSKDKLKK